MKPLGRISKPHSSDYAFVPKDKPDTTQVNEIPAKNPENKITVNYLVLFSNLAFFITNHILFKRSRFPGQTRVVTRS
jgi:hypothetical protein